MDGGKAVGAERLFEPKTALIAGDGGYEFYHALAQGAINALNDSGMLLVEVGTGQASGVGEIFAKVGLDSIATVKDLNGIERVVTARRPRRN